MNLKPDKNVKVPSFDFLSEGIDPKKCEQFEKDYLADHLSEDYQTGFNHCKEAILKLLEENKELESISYNGKKIYKIYGNVIEKIKEL